jgi:hypothetical protein
MGQSLKLIARWSAALLLSLLITLPCAFAAAIFGASLTEQEYYAGRERPPLGEDDLGLGLAALGATMLYGAGAFVVVWPLALWGSYRFARRVVV